MATTLTMPADADLDRPNLSLHNPTPDETAADEAAEILEGEELEAEEDKQEGDDEEEFPETKYGRKLTEADLEPIADTDLEGDEPQAEAESESEASATVVEPVAAEAAATAPPTPPAPQSIIDVLDEISDAETSCGEAEIVVVRLAHELKAAKKIYDGAVVKLRDLVRAVSLDRKRPLLTSPGAAAPAATDVTAPASTSESELPPLDVVVDYDAWKAASIGELGLKPALAEKLKENDFHTIGDLESLRAEIASGHAKWPKGIGAAKITAIEDAVVEWLTKNRDADLFSQRNVESAAIAADEAMLGEDERTPSVVKVLKSLTHGDHTLHAGDFYDVEPGDKPGQVLAIMAGGELVPLESDEWAAEEYFTQKVEEEATPLSSALSDLDEL